MTSAASTVSDGLFAADDEMKRWQRVEAEAWGIAHTAGESTVETQPAKTADDSARTSQPIAFIALLALVAFAGFWLYTHKWTPGADERVAKAVVAPAVARDVGDPCSVISELRAVQADAYVRLLNQTEDGPRIIIFGEQARAEVRLIDQLMEAEPSLTMAAAPIRFRSQLIADGVAGVEAGERPLSALVAEANEVGPQARSGNQAIADFETQRCAGS